MAQINKPSDYFNTVLYTGNGSTQSVTGVNFQPDLVWIKKRSAISDHMWHDIARGVTNAIRSNTTGAENSQSNYLTAFDSDGFTVGSSNDVNTNGSTFASWNWLASNTTASNTVGDINSTVSVNTTSGFSIVSWTGNGNASTIGHGLGETPSVIILKNRSIVEDWPVYHKNLTVSGAPAQNVYLHLDNSNGANDFPVWNDTAPTSSVFSVGGYAGLNGSGNNIIAYCFAEKKGFSKFGSYVGNGNADGTFVYTGFKPAFVLAKQSSASGNDWTIYDNKRNNYNVVNKVLYPNASGTEATASNTYDFLSNGFKLRTTDGRENASGSTYIYMAFAENPLVGTNNIPATAR
jgi:hypothetical protein